MRMWILLHKHWGVDIHGKDLEQGLSPKYWRIIGGLLEMLWTIWDLTNKVWGWTRRHIDDSDGWQKGY
jgi:hypothetical protein